MLPVLQAGNCKPQNDTIQDEKVVTQCWQIVRYQYDLIVQR